MSTSDTEITGKLSGKHPQVKIDQEKCKGCDLCLNLCPKHVFEESAEIGLKGYKLRLVKSENECSGCKLCNYFCPEGAITLETTGILDEIWERTQGIKKTSQGRGGWRKSKTVHSGNHFLSGNIACSWAAIDAGCRFFAGYPITPATEQSYEMERSMPTVNGIFIQMENEDASMAALIGASLAGAKPMTATSDPGFERMLENLSFALVNELPMVISLVQRTSPSTGRPTGTGSWLIRGTRWGPHGGTEHIVLYPSTVQDIYDDTIRAFNLSEKFRVPVILMLEASNAHLEESVAIPEEIDVFDRIYIPGAPPFGPTPDNSSPSMPKFGEGESLKVTGLTHNQWGVPCAESALMHEKMVSYLRAKIDSKSNELTKVEEFLLDDADIMIVAFGHTARASRWAIQEARKQGMKVGMLNIRTLYPFPDEKVKQWSKTAKCVLVPEMNQGQLFYVVRECALAPVVALTQPDGENINPKRILKFLLDAKDRYCQDIVPVHPPTIYNPPEWERKDEDVPDSGFTFQTPFCPGCGLGILRNCLLKSIEELNLPLDKIVVASGIGCTARLPNHVPFDSANTTHGYSIPFVTGIKLTQPDIKPIIVSGDGDLFDIGSGHSIHGARRNLPMTVICNNNYVFGMTGGQASSTTPFGAVTSTSTKGNKRMPFDLLKLMLGANVKYAARCPVSKPVILERMIKEALSYDGFSFIEVIAPCVTGYARRNAISSPAEILKRLDQAYMTKDMAQKLSPDQLRERFKLLFPAKEEISSEELLRLVYGRFNNLKEYMNLVPEVK